MQFRTTVDNLDQFAKQFWHLAGDLKIFAFHGNMGAGKTTLITALCRYKGVDGVMSSPTFSIINEYVSEGSVENIFHIDLYRLKNEAEVLQAGVEECIFSGSICMIEWPEIAPALFDESSVHIFIEPISESERSIEIKLPSPS